jgi:hypothetical protein
MPNNMTIGVPCNITIRVSNLADDDMDTPIVNVTFTNMKFNEIVHADDSNSRDITNYVNGTKSFDSNTNTLTLRLQRIPGKGFVQFVLNVTPEGSGNASVDVEVIPLYQPTVKYVASAEGYVKGFGNVMLNVVDVNGKPLSGCTVLVDNSQFVSKVLEGSHRITVSKNGYVPVTFDFSINANENKTFTVIMATPDELVDPKVLYGEGNYTDLVNSIAKTFDTGFVKPNATIKAHRYVNVSVTGTGEKIIAVKVPVIARGNLWALVNDSIEVYVNGQKVNVTIVNVSSNESVLLIKVIGNANVSVRFEGRQIGDVDPNGDGDVTLYDAVCIAYYYIETKILNNNPTPETIKYTSFLRSGLR